MRSLERWRWEIDKVVQVLRFDPHLSSSLYHVSLDDLRTYLRNQRTSALNSSFSISGPELDLSLLGGEPSTSSKRSPSNTTILASPPSASLCSNLTTSMSLNDAHPEMCERYHLQRGNGSNSIDQEKTLVPISESNLESDLNSFSFNNPQSNGQTSTKDGIPINGDELDALQFLASYERYRRKFSNLTRSEKNRCPRFTKDGEIGLRSVHSRADSTGLDSNADDSSQSLPLRRDLDRILNIYLSPSSPSNRKSKSNNLTQQSDSKKRRLQWLIDLGLLSEELVSTAISRSESTTHPSILEPIYDVVYHHLSIHVLPNFLLASTRNLSKTTRKGRLAVGLSSLILAILFTILLLLRPSPLSSNDPKTNVLRWFRILTFPLWEAGFGYCIAAKTGVCVWLTLRGNHEPEEEEVSRWENHSIDGDREVIVNQKSKSKNGKSNDNGKDGGCKPCQKDRCWENEDEKEEIEDESLVNNSKDSTSNSNRNLVNGLEVVEENEDQEEGNDQASRLDGEEEGSKAWLAPELLNLLSKFHLAPKFLYGTDPNQCGLNGQCSSNRKDEESRSQIPTSNFSNSSIQSKPKIPVTPLPLAYSSTSISSPSKQSQVRPSSSIISISPSKSIRNISDETTSSNQKLSLTIENLNLASTEKENMAKEQRKSNLWRKSWSYLKRYTGFADKTEKVKESRVRQIQQMIALKALVSTTIYSLIGELGDWMREIETK